jgi:hypothetical protein
MDPHSQSPKASNRRERGSALDRARKDLAAGRPDLARDRISGYLYTLHRAGRYDQQAYLLYGDALFAMRDFAKAGAAWLLTEKSGAEFDQALAAFKTRYGSDPVQVLNLVKPHAPSEDYPPAVQERLRSWDYRYKPYRPRGNPHAITEHSGEDRVAGLRPVEFGCIVAVLFAAAVVVYFLWVRMR